MDLSDHSSDDEDYDPTRDEEKDLEEEEGAPVRPLETALVKISRRRANAAEDLFRNMMDDEKSGLNALRGKMALVNVARRSSGDVLEKVLEKSMRKAQEEDSNGNGDELNLIHEDSVDIKESMNKKKNKRGVTKAERNQKILSRIFGKTQASMILDSMGSYELEAPKKSKTISKGSNRKKGTGFSRKAASSSSSSGSSSSSSSSGVERTGTIRKHEAVSEEITASIKASLKNIARKTKVVEKRKFAGQEITVERNEMAVKSQFEDDDKPQASSSRSSSSSGGGGGGALDSVLDTIKGPKAISTVTKSAFDWQSHKAKEGLEDELAPAAKDGYLARQDFLTRVDVRKFEKERDERLRQQTTTRAQA